jgi:transposase
MGGDGCPRSLDACCGGGGGDGRASVRFGAGAEPVVAWLRALPAPVRACYEAGPTGYGLARAAQQAGVRVEVIAPSKTPRAAGERIKTDRRDAELLVRLLMAGQLRPVAIPTVHLEGLRDLTPGRDRIRHDLLRARHRVSKLLLRYGRMWSSDRGTWTREHHHWLVRQRFDDPNLELAYLDALAAVDPPVRRRDVLDQRLLLAAQDAEVASAVARLRAFRGINTITAIGLHAEIHGWQRFARPGRLAAWIGLVPSLYQAASRPPAARSPSRDHATPAGCWWKPPGTTSAAPAAAPTSSAARKAPTSASSTSPGAVSTASTASTPICAAVASPPTSPPSPPPASSPASCGPPGSKTPNAAAASTSLWRARSRLPGFRLRR